MFIKIMSICKTNVIVHFRSFSMAKRIAYVFVVVVFIDNVDEISRGAQ